MVRIGPSGLGVLWDPGDGLDLPVSDALLEGLTNRLTSGVLYFLATSTSLMEMLGSSSCGTVFMRALMSTMIQVIEYEVQLKDLSRMYSYIYDAQNNRGSKERQPW